MKKLLLSTVALTVSIAFSQTTLFQDNFGSGGGNWTLSGTGDNSWVVNSAYTGYPGLIPDTPNQPGGIANGPQSSYLHIHYAPLCTALSVCNAAFESGSASNRVAQLTNPLVTTGMSNVTLSFWYICNGAAGTAYGTVEYSTDNGASWTNAGTYQGVSTWTQVTLSLPAWNNQASLLYRFVWQNNGSGVGSDPAFSVDDVLVTATGEATNTISTGTTLGTSGWCEGTTQNVSVGFTASGTYNAGNVYTAQLSDATGSFAAPTVIGTLSSSANGSLSINATVSGATAAGNGYRVRVIASDPATVGTDNTQDLTIYALPTVGLGTLPASCVNHAPFALSGGTPAGGMYTGPGVTTGLFAPSVAGVGNHLITYTYTDGNGCTNDATQIAVVDACAALDELDNEVFVLYPNPATDEVFVTSKTEIETIVVVDLHGKEQARFGNQPSSFSVQGLPKGVYVIRIETASFTATKRLVVN